MDKKWGKKTVFWSLVIIFILLLSVAGSFLFGRDHKYSFNTNGNAVYQDYDPNYGGNGISFNIFKKIGQITQHGQIGVSSPAKGPMMPVGDMAVHVEESYARGGVAPMPTMPPYYGGAPASTAIPVSGRQVVHNGSVDLVVSNGDVAVSSITTTAERLGGFVESSYLRETVNEKKVGHITIRVPATRFKEAIQAIKSTAVKVKNENVTSQDMTTQVVDYAAQVASLKTEEAFYLDLLEEAEDSENFFAISNKLSEIRSQIRWSEGQMNEVNRQVALSTISVSLEAQAEVDIFGITWTPFTTIKQACRMLLQNLTWFVDAMIYLIFQIPIILLHLAVLGVGIAVIWHAAMWLKRLLTGEKR